MAVRFRIVENRLPAITATMLPRVEAVVAKAALDVERSAKLAAPVDTGTLRNSIRATKSGPAAWRIVVGVDYGVFVEFGTRHMAAQPFLLPTVQGVRPAFIAALRQVVTT